jgi:hypothetical protein
LCSSHISPQPQQQQQQRGQHLQFSAEDVIFTTGNSPYQHNQQQQQQQQYATTPAMPKDATSKGRSTVAVGRRLVPVDTSSYSSRASMGTYTYSGNILINSVITINTIRIENSSPVDPIPTTVPNPPRTPTENTGNVSSKMMGFFNIFNKKKGGLEPPPGLVLQDASGYSSSNISSDGGFIEEREFKAPVRSKIQSVPNDLELKSISTRK